MENILSQRQHGITVSDPVNNSDNIMKTRTLKQGLQQQRKHPARHKVHFLRFFVNFSHNVLYKNSCRTNRKSTDPQQAAQCKLQVHVKSKACYKSTAS